MAPNKKMVHAAKNPTRENSVVFKTKHRYADSKYRQNVQSLFQLLQEDTSERLTKDILLKFVSHELMKLQNSIIFTSGSEKLKKCDDKFLQLFEIGENIWRVEKNPSRWWDQMHNILKNWMEWKDKESASFLEVPLSYAIEVSCLSQNETVSHKKYAHERKTKKARA